MKFTIPDEPSHWLIWFNNDFTKFYLPQAFILHQKKFWTHHTAWTIVQKLQVQIRFFESIAFACETDTPYSVSFGRKMILWNPTDKELSFDTPNLLIHSWMPEPLCDLWRYMLNIQRFPQLAVVSRPLMSLNW